MNEIKNRVMTRSKEDDLFNCDLSLLNVGCKVSYNNEKLYHQLMSYISSHVLKEKKEIDFWFSMIVDGELFRFIENEVNGGKRAQIVHLSYCSKEKGTIRALRFEYESFNVFLSQKTPAIFIEFFEEKKYYYIIDEEYLEKLKFKFDGFKFFEHVLSKTLNMKDTVLFHSAAVQYGDSAVIIIGPKRSGKTTLFMDMIRRIGCTPMAFDKCHLKYENDYVDVYGMPTRLRVLAGTLSKYGDEMKYLIPDEYKNASDEVLWEGKSESKIDMSFKDFERFCGGKNFVHKSKLKYIIIPNVSKDNSDEVRLASYDEFRLICETQIFTPNNPEEDWWSNCGKDYLEKMECNYQNMIRYIWNNIPVIKISTSSNTGEVLKLFAKLFS